MSATVGAVQGCVAGLVGVPAYLAEKGADDARSQLRKLEDKVKAAPKGSKRRAAYSIARDRARSAYEKAEARTKLPGVALAERVRRVVNRNAADVERAKAGPQTRRERIAAQDLKKKEFENKQRSRGAARRVASKTLNVAGKVVKGAGIAGVAIGAVSDVKKYGAAKGLTATAGAAAGGWAAGAGAAAGCAALAVATAGVGGVACGLAVVGASIAGSYAGKEATKYVYDKALAPVGRKVGDVAEAVGEGAKAVGDGLAKVDDGAKQVAEAVNPTNWF